MADFYSYKPGTLITIPSSNQGGASILSLSDLFPSPLLVGTTFNLDRTQDVEYQKTLTGLIYAYAFGEAVGRLQIGGLLFFESCDGSGGGQAAIKVINDYYDKNNVYARTSPIVAGIGGVSFSCYLETLSANLESSEFNYGSFNLMFSKLPPKNK